MDPVVVHATYYRCPRCNCSFRSMDRYIAHAEGCSDELDTAAKGLIGSWVAKVGMDESIYGRVVDSDGAMVRVKGVRIRSGKSRMEIFAHDNWMIDHRDVRDGSSASNTYQMAVMDANATAREIFKRVFLEAIPEEVD